MLRLGFAQTDITPDKPVNLVGFYREDNLSKGVLEPLIIRVTGIALDRCLLTVS